MSKLQNLFSQAFQLHQSGRVQEAITAYLKLLRKQRHNPQLLFLLGTAYLQTGQTKQGVELLQRSLSLDPKNAAAHYNLGKALNGLQRLDEALASYEQALAMAPGYAEAYNNRGSALADLKRLDEALASYDQALAVKPDFAEVYINRGNVLTDLKRLDEALASYEQALAIKPDYAVAHYNRGKALRDLKRLDEALASFEQALAINPGHAEAYIDRGNALADLKRLDEALASFEQALAIKSDHAVAHYNRGNALSDIKRLDEALASYDQALAIKPDYAEAYYNRGNALMDFKRLDEALASYDQALAIKPDYAEAYNNRGNALRELKRLDEALASFDQALAIKLDYAEAYWNKALLLILLGEFPEGWKLYEWRLKVDSLKTDYYTFPQSSWRGQADLQGKRLLIHGEQGLGDVMQFCRYLPQVKTLGAEIIFEVPEPLAMLVSTLPCPMTIVAKGNPLPEFDAYCPVMSLPYVFETTVKTIPAPIPYLFSDPNKLQQWQQRLGNKDCLRVGLAWSGSAAHKNDINRSIRLEKLLPLMDLPVEWHSLQNEYRQHDLAVLDRHPEIRQHQDELKDFADTAALIECLDLVVSVDTSVAHLAGAMGKQVWILLPYSPDYRWMMDREDTPWYPTATLYRQPSDGDWESVILPVISALEALAKVGQFSSV